MDRLEKDYVEIFNNTTSSISLKSDRIRLNFAAPTRRMPVVVKKVKIEDLMDIYNARGCAVLFNDEMLLIKDTEARELLGLDPLTQYTKTLEELEKFITESDLKEFESFLMYCSDQALENLFELAKTVPNTDLAKNDVLRLYTGKDAYKMYREMQEEESVEINKINSARSHNAPTKDTAKSETEAPVRRRITT